MPTSLDITTGGLRDRLIRDSLYTVIEDGLQALGWFDAGADHQPIQMTPEPMPAGVEVPANTLAVTREDVPTDLIEMGSTLSEDRHVFYIDFYAETDALGEHVMGDVRDILRGKHPTVGRTKAILPVFDRTQVPVPAVPAFVCEIDDVVNDRARDTTRAWEAHWFMVRCEVVDER